MSTLCVKIRPHRAPELDLARVRELSEGIASDRKLVSHFGIVEGEDEVRYANLMFDTADLPSLWRQLQAKLYGNEEFRDALLRASMAMFEGKDPWTTMIVLWRW